MWLEGKASRGRSMLVASGRVSGGWAAEENERGSERLWVVKTF